MPMTVESNIEIPLTHDELHDSITAWAKRPFFVYARRPAWMDYIDGRVIYINGRSTRIRGGYWAAEPGNNVSFPNESETGSMGLDTGAAIMLAIAELLGVMSDEILAETVRTICRSAIENTTGILDRVPQEVIHNGHNFAINTAGECAVKSIDGRWTTQTGQTLSEDEVKNRWTMSAIPNV